MISGAGRDQVVARNVAARAAHFRRGLNFFTSSNKPFIHSSLPGPLKPVSTREGSKLRATHRSQQCATRLVSTSVLRFHHCDISSAAMDINASTDAGVRVFQPLPDNLSSKEQTNYTISALITDMQFALLEIAKLREVNHASCCGRTSS